MPPALEYSEDESGGESIPFNDGEEEERTAKKRDATPVKDAEEEENGESGGGDGGYEEEVVVVEEEEEGGEGGDEDEEEDEDEDEDVEEDVYVVEKIMGHEFAKDGALLLLVKWKGYENPEDQTLEPEKNLLEDTPEIVEEYYSKIGGRPEKPSKKRKSLGESSALSRDTASSKRSKKPRSVDGTPEMENNAANWMPKTKNWDTQVKSIDTIMRDPPTGNLFVYLNWNNDKKAKVSIQQCYEKCPQKMLQFYEQHLYVPSFAQLSSHIILY
ncbi:hypothetical protein ACO22_03793 [Paracoccidioides brasiliensis]|uniref:Chromo domain-containing protein n=1 Tax=Paracoccidioides brasiliensis TaxID=121759 RepID=A0A1D2JEY7_PARBR|nr:hypothetical protein ACO22_03793 [Paracoccidioides brasiliensis]